MSNIETLKRIDYIDINQFVAEINRNFAVIQNSPLYKGVPGKTGVPGLSGIAGKRGTNFLFVVYSKFVEQFPTELPLSSSITIGFLNQKINFQSERTKLLTAFGISEFLHNDIIVLTNSLMVRYDNLEQPIFIDTQIAFNQQANIESSIESKIEKYIQKYVDNNPVILAAGILLNCDSWAKSVADLQNQSEIQSPILTGQSAFYPYVPGVTDETGYKLDGIDGRPKHKYFGFVDSQVSDDISSLGQTFVFGSMNNYIKLLNNTINVELGQSNSAYVPGEGNIPAMVVLQNTDTNGILIGNKNSASLSSFGSIYKDSENNIVIKSDSGGYAQLNDYSKLLINKNRLRYDKNVEFGDNLNITNDLTLQGNIDSSLIKTNEKTRYSNLTNILELGNYDDELALTLITSRLVLPKYNNNVLVTDSQGTLINAYFLENAPFNVSEGIDELTPFAGYYNHFLTSDYYGQIVDKINNVTNYLKDSLTGYYTKKQISQDFVVDYTGKNASFGLKDFADFIVDVSDTYNRQITIGTPSPFIGATNIRINGNIFFGFSPDIAMVTNEYGQLINDYSIERRPHDAATPGIDKISPFTRNNHTLLTSDYYGNLVTKINNIIDYTNYHKIKENFANPEISGEELYYVEDITNLKLNNINLRSLPNVSNQTNFTISGYYKNPNPDYLIIQDVYSGGGKIIFRLPPTQDPFGEYFEITFNLDDSNGGMFSGDLHIYSFFTECPWFSYVSIVRGSVALPWNTPITKLQTKTTSSIPIERKGNSLEAARSDHSHYGNFPYFANFKFRIPNTSNNVIELIYSTGLLSFSAIQYDSTNKIVGIGFTTDLDIKKYSIYLSSKNTNSFSDIGAYVILTEDASFTILLSNAVPNQEVHLDVLFVSFDVQ